MHRLCQLWKKNLKFYVCRVKGNYMLTKLLPVDYIRKLSTVAIFVNLLQKYVAL